MKRNTILFAAFLAVGFGGCAGDADGILSPGSRTTDVPQADVLVPSGDLAGTSADLSGADAGETPRYTYVVASADPHIELADDAHADHLRAIGETIAAMPYDVAGAFVAGDIVHNLPYDTIDEYHADPNDRFDVAEAIFDGFPVPVYPAIGNHDQAIGRLPRQMTEQLFQEHFGVAPYYAVDLGVWKFIVLNNFQGPTQDPDDPAYDLQTGSLGTEQLTWLEDQLADGRPAILMLHFPLMIVSDLPAFLAAHADTARLVLTGHSHAWVNMGDHFGAPSMILGSSQFDGDSFMVLELDNALRTWRVLDWDRFHWGTSYALPWDAAE